MRPAGNAAIIGFLSLIVVTVIGAVILEANDHDPSRIFTFALAIVPILIVQLLQGNAAARDTEEIKKSVNGRLTKQLETLKDNVNSHVSNEIERIKSDGNAENRDSSNVSPETIIKSSEVGDR